VMLVIVVLIFIYLLYQTVTEFSLGGILLWTLFYGANTYQPFWTLRFHPLKHKRQIGYNLTSIMWNDMVMQKEGMSIGSKFKTQPKRVAK